MAASLEVGAGRREYKYKIRRAVGASVVRFLRNIPTILRDLQLLQYIFYRMIHIVTPSTESTSTYYLHESIYKLQFAFFFVLLYL